MITKWIYDLFALFGYSFSNYSLLRYNDVDDGRGVSFWLFNLKFYFAQTLMLIFTILIMIILFHLVRKMILNIK